jgi:DNA polymerase
VTLRRELARLEVDLALCDRCFGEAPRHWVRFDRPHGRGRVLLLTERPSRGSLETGERLGLGASDPATRFLRSLLAEGRIPAEEVVVGAAMLCRPKARDLEAAVSAAVCARECREHMRELVEIVQPRLVVPLGRRALDALRGAFPGEPRIAALRFPGSVGTTAVCAGTYIHPLYHTAVRARVTRREEDQRRDWRALGRLWQWIAGGERGAPPRFVPSGG